MNEYEIFLTIELARIAGVIDKDQEYDTTWDEGSKLYSEFINSSFNVDTEPLYECLESFLKNKPVKDVEKTNQALIEKIDKHGLAIYTALQNLIDNSELYRDVCENSGTEIVQAIQDVKNNVAH